MAEYRPVPEDDLDVFRRTLDYAFRAEAGPNPERDEDEPAQLGDRRGVYVDDELVTTGAHHQFTVTVRGEWQSVIGLSAVATLPEHRHQGHVRTLLGGSLAEIRVEGTPFSLLWPFKHEFYRRYGWGRLFEIGRYELEPADLAPTTDHPLAGGSFRRLNPDQFAELKVVDERYADRFDLGMRRTEDWYRHRFFDSWRGEPFVYGWDRDGSLNGYLRYTVEEEADDRELQVTDFGAPDLESAVNLYRFLYRHEAQTDQLRIHAPVGSHLFDLLDDPRAVEVTIRPGPMGRVVDVATGLESLPIDAPRDLEVTLDVSDTLCDWNDGSFELTAEEGALRVTPGEEGADRATLPIETLSRLALGSIEPQRAADLGQIKGDTVAIEQLQATFPTRDLFLREFF